MMNRPGPLLLPLIASAGALCALSPRALAQCGPLPSRFPAPEFMSEDTPFAPVLADLNGDQLPDLVYLSIYSGSDDELYVRYACPGAGFLEPVVYGPFRADFLDVLDINQDSYTDIVLGSRLGSLIVFAGTAAGELERRPENTDPDSVFYTFIDLNGDQLPDLISSGWGPDEIRLNLGDFTFSPPTLISERNRTEAMHTTGNLNGDAHPDLVVLRVIDEDFGFDHAAFIDIYLGNDSGGFDLVSSTMREYAAWVGLADMDGNGRDDLVWAEDYDGEEGLVVQFSTPGGQLGPLNRYILPLDGQSTRLVDLNQDGLMDVAAAGDEGTLTPMINDGQGGLVPRSLIDLGGDSSDLAFGDINRDGEIDIVSAAPVLGFSNNHEAGVIRITTGIGDAEFRVPVGQTLTEGLIKVVSADIDDDGDADIIASEYGDQAKLFVMSNSGGGVFELTQTITAGRNPRDFKIADLNNDDIMDLVVAISSGLNVVSVHLGVGGGQFGEPVFYQAGSGSLAIDVGDVNGDGVLDIVVTAQQGGTIHVLKGFGDGTFRDDIVFGVGGVARDILLHDFDNDGDLDAVTSVQNDGLAISLNPGLGGLFVDHIIPVPNVMNEIAGAYVNDDEYLDIIATDTFGDNLIIFLSDGAGSFVLKDPIPVGVYPDSVGVGDINADGMNDLVVGHIRSLNFAVLYATGDGEYTDPEFHGVGAWVESIMVEDLDADGDADIVMAQADQPGSPDLLVALTQPAPGICIADIDKNGELNFFDVSAFLIRYLGEDPLADLNQDGEVSFFDVSLFIEAYLHGCP